MTKTHYAYLERGNESAPDDVWSDTYCGLELESQSLTNNEKYVSCKKCLKALEKIRISRQKSIQE